MSRQKRLRKLVRAPNFTLQNGVIKIAGEFPNLMEPWSKTKIPDYLSVVDHSLAIEDKTKYEAALAKEETEFNLLVRQLAAAKKSLVVILQGRDGAGKSGATECLGKALGYDSNLFMSFSIGPPTEDELAHHYLDRFSKDGRMPTFGQVRVFDRSWQERVLVERVMKLTPKAMIHNSYGELRKFEWQLARQDTVIVKIWLDITKKEQKLRFNARKKDKPWKLSSSDYVARKHWKDYTLAANELFHRCGSSFAPQFIIASDNKSYSRITVLRIINQQLHEALGNNTSRWSQ